MMKYKGYVGHVKYDDEAKIFHGEVIGLNDVITFQGSSVAELERAFKDSIDDYLHWCKERGEKPEKTFSGTFNLRIPPELHAKLASQAKESGISLNSYVRERLSANQSENLFTEEERILDEDTEKEKCIRIPAYHKRISSTKRKKKKK